MLAPFACGTASRAVALVALAVIGGVVESAALLITVRLALRMSSGGVEGLELPFGATIDIGPAVAIALCCAVGAMVAHIAIAYLSAQLSARVLAATRAGAIGRFLAAGWPGIRRRDGRSYCPHL